MKTAQAEQIGDHSHTCANHHCNHVWVCDFTTERCKRIGALKDCKASGVIKAMQTNKEGPWCLLCYHVIMAKRIAKARGMDIKLVLLNAPE